MKVKLIEMTLVNWKGIPAFTLRANGNDCDVFGKNWAGKSTLASAYAYLCTGKDMAGKSATGRSSFEPKRITAGEVEHGAENEVRASIQLEDGSHHALKKVFRELWEGSRGGEKKLKGNTIDYSLDGMPCKEKEYLDFLSRIANPEQMQILINPAFFASMLPWERRRSILLELASEITDADVYAANPALADLPGILAGKPARSVEKHLALCKSQKMEIRKKIDEIPVRVSEVKRGVNTGPVDQDKNAEEVQRLQSLKEGLSTQILTLESGGAIADKKRDLAEVDTQLIALRNKESEAISGALAKHRAGLDKLRFSLGVIEGEISTLT